MEAWLPEELGDLHPGLRARPDTALVQLRHNDSNRRIHELGMENESLRGRSARAVA